MATILVNKFFHEQYMRQQLEPLNEVYFGKNKQLVQIEKAFEELFVWTDKYFSNKYTLNRKNILQICKRIQTSLEAPIKNLFGFDSVIVDYAGDIEDYKYISHASDQWIRDPGLGTAYKVDLNLQHVDSLDPEILKRKNRLEKTRTKVEDALKNVESEYRNLKCPTVEIKAPKNINTKTRQEELKTLFPEKSPKERFDILMKELERSQAEWDDYYLRYDEEEEKLKDQIDEYQRKQRMFDDKKLKYTKWLDRIIDQLEDPINEPKPSITSFESRKFIINPKKRSNGSIVSKHLRSINSSPFDARQCLIVDENGIKFNRKKIKKTFAFVINPNTFMPENMKGPYALTPKMLTALLLHEIGHNFTIFLIKGANENINPQTKLDEMFSDQFVAMYGYGADLIDAFEKMLALHRKLSVTFNDQDEHHYLLNRIHKILAQMAEDFKDSDLDPTKAQQLQNDINRGRAALRRIAHMKDYHAVNTNQSLRNVIKTASNERHNNFLYQHGVIHTKPGSINQELKSRMMRSKNR